MQFEPASWREYGVAADGHSVANPYDPRDAIFAAARLLAAAGAAKDLSGAVFSYNHATWYVNDVLSRAQTIADGVHPAAASFTRGIASVGFQSKSSRRGVATFKGGYSVALRPADRDGQHGQCREFPLPVRRGARTALGLRARSTALVPSPT